ncbi:hypothetical protein ACFVJW_26580 [Streptomyces libani]|uniref:hypothetical protein n=1 Tax=Streptomyces nigrescens TaxID=1920 RepID=UPI00362C127B
MSDDYPPAECMFCEKNQLFSCDDEDKRFYPEPDDIEFTVYADAIPPWAPLIVQETDVWGKPHERARVRCLYCHNVVPLVDHWYASRAVNRNLNTGSPEPIDEPLLRRWLALVEKEEKEELERQRLEELRDECAAEEEAAEREEYARAARREAQAKEEAGKREFSEMAELKIVLGRDRDTGKSTSVTAEQMCSGMYLLGTQGSGKSSLLTQIALQRIQQRDSVIVLDPHGQLVDNLIAKMPKHRLADAFLLDLSDARNHPFRLNIFHCADPGDETERARTRGRVLRVFRRIWPEIEAGQYAEKILRYVITTLIYNPGCTLADVPGWFRGSGISAQAVANIQDPDTRSFWTYDLPSLPQRDRSFQTEPILNRIKRLLSDDLLRRLLCSPGPPLGFRQLIRQRRTLLIKLPVDADVIGEAASLAGIALFSLIYATTFDDRPKDYRDTYTLIVDEFQNFVTSEFVRLFVGGRKYGAQLVLAHQYMGQLDLPGINVNRRGVLTARTVVSFHTTPYDAVEVSPLYAQLEKNWARDNLVVDVAAALERHPVEAVKKFALRHVKPLIQGSRLQGGGYPTELDFGWGTHRFRPEDARHALTLLNEILYAAERNGHVSDIQRDAVVEAIADVSRYPYLLEDPDKTRLDADLSTVLTALNADPIVEYQPVGGRTVATQLPALPSRVAFAKVGERVYHMETLILPEGVDEYDAQEREDSLLRQTHREYCSTRAAVDEQILSSPCRKQERPSDTPRPQPPIQGPAQKAEESSSKPPSIGRRSSRKKP